MKFNLFQQVALAQDIPDKHLQRGDVATVVEHHPIRDGEDGYSLEVFIAVGETAAVVVVAESAMQPLLASELLSVRPLAA